MYNIKIYYPLILFVYQRFIESKWTEKYTSRCFQFLGCKNPIELLMTMMVIHIIGFEYLSHYNAAYPSCKAMMEPLCNILSSKQLLPILGAVTIGIPTWNIFRFQRRILQENGPELYMDGKLNTLHIDWTVLTSFSNKREGAQRGYNKRYKGKPCFNLLLPLLGKVFIDCKLCKGKSNPKKYFQKMIRRAIAMGHKFSAVCGDAAFGNVKNVLFLSKLSLHYALGASSQLGIVSEGIEAFKKLRHKGSSKIIAIKKGIHAFDFGFRYIGSIGNKDVYTRVIICCRIHRRRNKKGKLKVRYYYYSILTDFDWSMTKVLKYYRTRQNVENAIKELKYHYSLNRMPHRTLKANEFYIASKILAMSMVKLFQLKHLPKSLQSMRRKTLIRKVFASALLKVTPLRYPKVPITVDVRRKSKYSWHFKRITQNLIRDHSLCYAMNLAG